MFKTFPIVLVVVLTLMLLLLLPRGCTPASATTSRLESRVFRLESEISWLRSQISRLQSQVSRQANAPSPNIASPAPPITPVPSQPSLSPLADDPMFKRLATLVIELKERIVALETQLNELDVKSP